MSDNITLPDGSLFPRMEGESYGAAMRAAYAKYPEAFGRQAEPEKGPESGFTPALKAGVKHLKGDIAALAGRTGLMDTEAAEKYKAQQEAEAQKIFKPTEEGWTEAPLTKLKELAGGSLPYMAAPAAAGAAAFLLPEAAAAAPVLGGLMTGAEAAGAAGAGLASAAQFTGSNLARQMEQGKSLKETDLGAAALAAVPQAALDVVSLKMIPGVRNILAAGGAKVSEEAAKRAAQEGLKNVAADYLKATGKTMSIEGLTEAGQQVFERLQAGLSLTDAQARQEYWDNFLGGAVLGGALAPAGRFVERGAEKAKAAELKTAADQKAAEEAASAEEAAKTAPEALKKLDDDYRAAQQQKLVFDDKVAGLKVGKGASEEEKAASEAAKQERAAFLKETYIPLRQEYNVRKDAIAQMYEQQQAAIEAGTAEQPTAKQALSSDVGQYTLSKEGVPQAQPYQMANVLNLGDRYQQLKSQLDKLQEQYTQGADIPTQQKLETQMEEVQAHMNDLAPAIERMGGSTLTMEELTKSLEASEKKRLEAMALGDIKAAKKHADTVQDLTKRIETVRKADTGMGATQPLFREEPAQPEAQGVQYATYEKHKGPGADLPATPTKPVDLFSATAEEATPLTQTKPAEKETLQTAQTKADAAKQKLDSVLKTTGTKDVNALYQALDAVNQAQDTVSRAQENVGRPKFKAAVIDIFDPANLINTAIANGDTKLLNDMAAHADRTAMRTALDQTSTDRERLVKILENRLDLGGSNLASTKEGPETGMPLQSVKRERVDLFSKMYNPKQQALFKNGTYPDKELQSIFDQGGPAAVEYENVMRDVQDLQKKVTTKQGNAKQSLYEQLVDLAAQHEALTQQLESGVAKPTMREKTAELQAKMGKGEAPAERQMDAAEVYQLKRKIASIESKYKAVEGKVTPIRDEILGLYNSMYKNTPLEKASVVSERKAREARVYRTEAEEGVAPFMDAFEKISEPSTGKKGLREINGVELDLKPDDKAKNTVYLSLIRALDGAEKGAASAALKKIVSLADRHGITLILRPEKVGKKGLDAKQLEAWYERNGFKSGDVGMYRKPEATTYAKPAKSRAAATAARIARGDVRYEAENSTKMRQLAMELGMEETAYDKFGEGLMKRVRNLEEKHGKYDPAVTSFRIQMAKALEAKAIELGKKTPEYKATLKEQIEIVREALSQSKQTLPTKRTGQVTRKQSGAPKRLRSASPESRAEGEAENERSLRSTLKDFKDAIAAEKSGTAYRLREGDTAATVDAAEAQKVIDGLKLPENVKFVYAPTPGKIPVRLLTMMAKEGVDPTEGMVQGAVFPDGTVLVVGDQHASVKDLEETIAHELIGHYGIDTIIGHDRLNAFAKKTDVIALAEQLGGKDLVREVLNTVRANADLGRSEAVQKLQALREIIAHTSEARVTESFREKASRWLKELVGMVRAGLREMGLKNLAELSTSDVFYMLKQSRKAFANKQIGPYKSADGEMAFRRRTESSEYGIGRPAGVIETMLGNMMGLAGRVQFVDQYAALEAAVKKGLSAKQISSLEATNANYLLRFGQQRSQFAGQFMTNGPVKAVHTKKDGGVETVYKSEKGVSMMDVAKKVGEAGIGNDTEQEDMFTLYMAGKRAKQVGWDKLNYDNPADAKAKYDKMMAKLGTSEKAKKAFEEAAKLYQQYNAGLLDFLVDTGALSKGKADELKAISYVPFYRINGDGEVQLMIDKEKPIRIANTKDQPQLKQLVGGNTEIMPIFTSAAQNTFMITGMGLRNQAVKETSFMLQKLGIASRVASGMGPKGDNVVRFFKHGQPYYALIDTDAYGIPADLIVKGMEGIKTSMPAIVKAMGVPSQLLRNFVVRMPTYALRQIIRDPLNAWLTTGTDATPILSSMKELAHMVAGRSEAETKLMEAGAISSNVYSGDEADMGKFLEDIAAGKSMWEKAIGRLDAFALQGDAATRAVIYKDSLAKGMSEQEALLRTLESMNFSRRGVSPSMHALSVMIPFFNAQIQGLDVIYRAFKGDMPYSEQLKIREKMIQRGLMMAAGTIAYAAMMEDDEAYKRARPEERYANWFVYVPGVSEPVRVPIPFEMGFLFKALPEAVWNAAMQDEKAGKAAKGLASVFMQTVPNPVPQALKPGVEAVLGKSFYGGDIESAREKEMMATDRYRENTTELSKLIGSVTGKVGVSPIMLDHLIRGYTGGLGVALVQLANPILATDSREIAQPSTKPSKLPLIGGLFQPVEGRGTLDEAYDRMAEIRQIKGTYNKLVEEGRKAEAKEFAQNYANDLAAASTSGAVQKQLGEIAKRERMVKASPSMTTEQKDAELQRLDKLKMSIANRFLAVSDRTTRQ